MSDFEGLGKPGEVSDDEHLAMIGLGLFSVLVAVIESYEANGLRTPQTEQFRQMYHLVVPRAQKIAHKRGWEKFAALLDDARERFPDG